MPIVKFEPGLLNKTMSLRQRFTLAGLGALLILGLAGCTAMRPSEQRLVAKPNMTFSDSAAFTYNSSRLFPQMATGFAATGGAQNSGCTSCR
jgi:hypothetical protein